MSLIPVHPTRRQDAGVADVANDASEASEPELLRLAIEAAEEVERPGAWGETVVICTTCWLDVNPYLGEVWSNFDVDFFGEVGLKTRAW